MPGQVEALVVLQAPVLAGSRSLERRQPRGDGVVAPRLKPDVIRRIRIHQVDGLAVQEPVDVGRVAGVTAQQPVVAQYPQVARLRDRIVRRLGDFIRVGQALLELATEQLGQFVGIEPQQRPVDAGALQLRQLDGQQLQIPVREFRGLVVGDAVRPDLLRRQIASNMDRHLLQPELLRREKSGVTGNDHASVVYNDRDPKTKLTD